VSCIEQLEGVASVRAQQTVTVTLNNGKNIDFQAIFIMNNSKLDFIQSVSEQKQKADQLQTSLHRLSETLKAFEMTIEQSEEPITQNSMLLQQVQRTTIALKSHLSSILTEIGNLSPQAIKETTASYKAQIDALSTQLASIDITEISKVKSSIDSFSVSLQDFQATINRQLQGIKIDQTSLEKSIQSQVQQVIASHSKQINSQFQSLLTEKLNNQRAFHGLLGIVIFTVLMLLISFYFAFQARTNLKTIEAQKQMIQQNAQTITSQINYLNSLRR
jgi:predicted PurR-regulated permease PerM